MSEPAAVDRPGRPAGFVTRTWKAEPHQLREIRAELHRWLAPFELTTDAVHDVVLAVNEAVSNAVVHAYSPATAFDTVDVTLRADGDTLQVEVVDHGRRRPGNRDHESADGRRVHPLRPAGDSGGPALPTGLSRPPTGRPTHH